MEEVKVKSVNDCLIFYPEIDLDLYSANNFKQFILKTVEENKAQKIIFNLQAVSYMDSSGVGALVSLVRQYKSSIQVRICEVAEAVLNVLKLTKLDQLFTIYPTEQESLDSFR